MVNLSFKATSMTFKALTFCVVLCLTSNFFSQQCSQTEIFDHENYYEEVGLKNELGSTEKSHYNKYFKIDQLEL